MNLNILVSGGQGFIGSAICKELLENGYNVISIDNFSKYGFIKRNHDDHPNFTLIQDDIINFKASWEYSQFRDVDYIIHCAAKIGGIKYFHSYASDLLETNKTIDTSVIKLAKYLHQKHNLQRLIVFSSSMVYERATEFPTKESDLPNIPPPISSYGFSKLCTEYSVRAAWEQYKLPYTIIRPFNATGIGEEDFLKGESHVLPEFVKKLLIDKQDPLHILGNGNQIRHFTNVADIALATKIIIEDINALNQDFNISIDKSTSILELAGKVWDQINSGKTCNIVTEIPYPHDVRFRMPDVTKAKEMLNFEAKIPLKQSISEVIEYIRGKI